MVMAAGAAALNGPLFRGVAKRQGEMTKAIRPDRIGLDATLPPNSVANHGPNGSDQGVRRHSKTASEGLQGC